MMHRRQSQGQFRPKISTMPRQKTEAAAYLDIYKLVNEKKRLQLELETMNQRRDRLLQRLSEIETQVTDLETSAHDLKNASVTPPPTVATNSASSQPPSGKSETFDTVFLEY